MKFLSAFVGFLAVLGVVLARSPLRAQTLDSSYLQQRLFVEGFVNDTINAAIEKIRPFDPVNMDRFEFTAAGHNISIEEVIVEGFSNLYASEIERTGVFYWTFEFDLELPSVVASIGHWEGAGSYFHGNGTALLNIENLKISITATVNIMTRWISNLKIVPSVEVADVQLTGVYDNDVLSQYLSGALTGLLNDGINNTQLFEKIAAIIENIVNNASK